jgi:UDP-glucose 4-epimerase
LAEAHVIAVKRMIEGRCKRNYEVFNLGTGKGISVMEVVKSFERVSGMNLNYMITDRRPGDVEKVWADTTYANRELGWKANKTLDDAILTAWNWEKSYRGLNG